MSWLTGQCWLFQPLRMSILRVFEGEVMEDGQDVVGLHVLDEAGAGVEIWKKQIEQMRRVLAVVGDGRR